MRMRLGGLGTTRLVAKRHSHPCFVARYSATCPNWAGKFWWTNRICMSGSGSAHQCDEAVFQHPGQGCPGALAGEPGLAQDRVEVGHRGPTGGRVEYRLEHEHVGAAAPRRVG